MLLCIDVVLDYFSTALGPALTEEAGLGWSNFMDLMIEVVKETVKSKWGIMTLQIFVSFAFRR